MKNNTVKKFGRRAAGTYGRLGTKKLKRSSAKAVRKFIKEKIIKDDQDFLNKIEVI